MSRNRLKPWETVYPGRRGEGNLERRRVLIICEDSKSSCFYFRAFAIDPDRAEVQTDGTGMNN
jgi:hypothetical protein